MLADSLFDAFQIANLCDEVDNLYPTNYHFLYLTVMIEIIPDLLYATEPEALKFGKGLTSSAYFLIRPEGNALVYNAKNIDSNFLSEKGGIDVQYLSNKFEAAGGNTGTSDLYCPSSELKSVEGKCSVTRGFMGDFNFDPSFTVLQTAGTTPGSSCFLWSLDGFNILFTGTTLFLNKDGNWVVNVERRNATKMIESLEKLKQYDFDMVVPFASGHSIKRFERKSGVEGVVEFEIPFTDKENKEWEKHVETLRKEAEENEEEFKIPEREILKLQDSYENFDDVLDEIITRLKSGSIK